MAAPLSVGLALRSAAIGVPRSFQLLLLVYYFYLLLLTVVVIFYCSLVKPSRFESYCTPIVRWCNCLLLISTFGRLFLGSCYFSKQVSVGDCANKRWIALVAGCASQIQFLATLPEAFTADAERFGQFGLAHSGLVGFDKLAKILL